MIARPAAILLLALLAACARDRPEPRPAQPESSLGPAPTEPVAPIVTTAPPGRYTIDRSHANLVFRIDHLGFSDYVGSFPGLEAELQFDPSNPSAMSVNGAVDLTTLQIPNPPAGFAAELLSAPWLGAGDNPKATFRSTRVELLDQDSARVTGDLQFRGVVAPFTLEVDFRGGYPGMAPYDPHARIGFSARGVLKRSAHGMNIGLPPEGSTMGVGDDVRVEIDAEFTGPPLAAE
ncbi:MAG: polyisoprenoid-binding protein [Parvularculaceae bacterium]|jgi:polyisoprenoid-binding protein YceI|nr:polyisoprenoid-binding protein [Parvularculaceae bacterium]